MGPGAAVGAAALRGAASAGRTSVVVLAVLAVLAVYALMLARKTAAEER